MDFSSIANEFPTLIYSGIIVVLTLYWLLVIIGMLDLDIIHLDIDANGLLGGLTGFLLTFGLTGVPVTIVLTLISFIAWPICALSSFYLLPLVASIDLLVYLLAMVIVVGSFMIAVILTAPLTRLLRPLFKISEAPSKNSIIGQFCTITTSSVTEKFGQGEVEQSGASLLIDLRAESPNDFKRGEQALIIEYCADQDCYLIVKESH